MASARGQSSVGTARSCRGRADVKWHRKRTISRERLNNVLRRSSVVQFKLSCLYARRYQLRRDRLARIIRDAIARLRSTEASALFDRNSHRRRISDPRDATFRSSRDGYRVPGLVDRNVNEVLGRRETLPNGRSPMAWCSAPWEVRRRSGRSWTTCFSKRLRRRRLIQDWCGSTEMGCPLRLATGSVSVPRLVAACRRPRYAWCAGDELREPVLTTESVNGTCAAASQRQSMYEWQRQRMASSRRPDHPASAEQGSRTQRPSIFEPGGLQWMKNTVLRCLVMGMREYCDSESSSILIFHRRT